MVSDSTLKSITKRLVERFHPERIILFGSQARGMADEHSDVADAEELTPFAITARYPGEDEEVSRVEAARAIEIAGRVRKVVRAALADAGINLPNQ